MKVIRYSIATAEVLLIFPAVFFMTAVFLRSIQPNQLEPAHTAQQIVTWYAMRPHIGLWLLLIALPLIVLLSGGSALLRAWNGDAALRQAARQTLAVLRAHLATCIVAMATLTAACILAVVALHVLTN